MQRRQIVYTPKPTPMERLSQKHLHIAQLCEQRSCELKMINRLKEWQKSPQHMRHGGKEFTNMAHTRFFGVQMSKEDKEALKLLDMMQKMSALEAGNTVRDFPLFGMLEDVFFTGIIDKLHFDKKRKLVLSEPKILNKNAELFVADSGEHEFQVGMHKLLFDRMMSGCVKKEQYIEHLQLQPQQKLGSEIQDLTQSLGCPSNTFRELLDHTLTTMASSKIRHIAKLQIIYLVESKDTNVSHGTMQVQFKEGQLRTELKGFLAYWKGQREPQGVDIEDAWKCESCCFKENCEWRNHDLVEAKMDCRLQLDNCTQDSLISGSPTTDAKAYFWNIFGGSALDRYRFVHDG